MAMSFVTADNNTFCPGTVKKFISGFCSLNRLQNIAPWDWGSWRAVAKHLTPENIHYDKYMPGIQFRFPKNLANHARLGTTEIVEYKNQFQGDSFTRVKPDFYLYEIGGKFNPKNPKSIERDLEAYPAAINEEFQNWYETLREGRRTGNPIVFFDREKMLEVFQNKEQDMIKQMVESTSVDKKVELIKKMIVLYENCANSVVMPNTHGEEIQNDYFKEENREKFYEQIYSHIEQIMVQNSSQGLNLLDSYREICEHELSKLTTNTSSRGSGVLNTAESRSRLYSLDNYALENCMIEQLDRIALLEGKYREGERISFPISEDLKELMKAIREPIGKEPHYDIPGAIHEVQHADKVIILGDIIARKEGLSNEDRRLVNIACALHDWKRVDNSANASHGVAGAELIVKEFKRGNLNFLGIKKEDVPIIAAAVCYHTYDIALDHDNHLKQHNVVDEQALSEMLERFGLDELKLDETGSFRKYLDRTKKIAAIVRDADNLDRFRFAKCIPRERPTYSYLMTESAKSVEVRTYANFLNQYYAKMVLEANYPNEILEQSPETDYVQILDRIRVMKNRQKNVGFWAEYFERKIDLDKLWDNLYSINPRVVVPRKESSQQMIESAVEAGIDTTITQMNEGIQKVKKGILPKKTQTSNELQIATEIRDNKGE